MQDKQQKKGSIFVRSIGVIMLLAGVILNWVIGIRSNYRASHMTGQELESAIKNQQSILVYSIDDMPDIYTHLWIVPKSYAKNMKYRIQRYEIMLCVLIADESEIGSVLYDVSHKAQLKRITIEDINVDDLNALSHMEHLESLHYVNYDNRESGKNALSLRFDGSFPALKELKINYTKLPSLGDIGRVTGLERVDLAFTDLSDITGLSQLTKVSELNLSKTNVRDITALQNMTDMRELYLDYAFVSDLSPLSEMAHLEVLSIHQNYYHDNHTEDELVEDLTPLSGKEALKKLILYGSEVKDLSPLKNLPALEDLELSYTPIEGLDTLKSLPALKYVGFYHCDNIEWDEVKAFDEWRQNSGREIKTH